MARRGVIGGITITTVALACGAAGRAILLHSTPEAGQATAPPPALVLRFNGRIEKRLSYVTLVGGPRNAKILLLRSDPEAPPDVLRFTLPVLGPGVYRVEWKVLSVDGHFPEGVVGFTVVAPHSEVTR